MPTVELSFTALPAHVRTARLLAATVGRRSGLDEAYVDEVKLAVGEACARAVGLHDSTATTDDVLVTISDDDGAFTVTIRDRAPGDEGRLPEVLDGAGAFAEPAGLIDGGAGSGDLLPPGFGLAVIAGLVDDVDVTAADPGTLVRLRWPLGSVAEAPRTG